MTSLLLSGLLLGCAWFWLDSARARELATAIAAEMCARRDLQFLDQTVALSRLGLRRTRRGLVVRRLYRFDYSEEGVGRHTGHMVMLGSNVEEFSLGLPSDPEQAPTSGTDDPGEVHEDRKVIPFRRRPP